MRDRTHHQTVVAIATIQEGWRAGIISAQEAMVLISEALDRCQ